MKTTLHGSHVLFAKLVTIGIIETPVKASYWNHTFRKATFDSINHVDINGNIVIMESLFNYKLVN